MTTSNSFKEKIAENNLTVMKDSLKEFLDKNNPLDHVISLNNCKPRDPERLENYELTKILADIKTFVTCSILSFDFKNISKVELRRYLSISKKIVEYITSSGTEYFDSIEDYEENPAKVYGMAVHVSIRLFNASTKEILDHLNKI